MASGEVDLKTLEQQLNSIDMSLRNQEAMYERFHRMGTRLLNGTRKIDELKGKDVVLFLGPTGSGKSTIANSVIAGKEHL